MNRINKLIGIFLIFGYCDCDAQKEEIQNYFLSIRNKQPVNSFSFRAKNEDQYIKAISIYLDDTLSSIRSEAYFLLSSLGQRTEQKTARSRIVKLLLRGWRDPDLGIKGQIENSITRFQIQDFDHTAIDTLKSLMHKLPPYPGKLFKLVGYLGLQDQASKIKFYIEGKQPPLKSNDRWAGYLALARLGDQQALDLILNRVRTFGINDDVIFTIFPDLVYTRTYRAIEYLEEVLFSDEKNCSPASPHSESQEKISCAYRVMELLAPAIKDYPVAIGVTGDLVEDDYPKALDKTRVWFKQKNSTYDIIRDTF